jgi:hypothetical protein
MSRPLYRWERAPGSHWIGGCVGLNVGDYTQNLKFLTPPEIELRPFGSPGRSQYEYGSSQKLL